VKLTINVQVFEAGAKSIFFQFTPDGGGTSSVLYANLTPAGNPSCSGKNCVLTTALRAGTYGALVRTYDGPLVKGKPSGKRLSQDLDVPASTLKGAPPMNLALSGGLKSAEFLPKPGTVFAGSQKAGYTSPKCFAEQQIRVFGLTTSGYLVIGAGAPKPSLTSDSPNLVIALKQKGGNTFTVDQQGVPIANGVAHFTAKLTPKGKPSKTAIVKLTLGGNVCGVAVSWQVPSTSSGPMGLAADSNGLFWFTEFTGNKIGNVTTNGAFTEHGGTSANAGPNGMTLGPDGALWFNETNHNAIGRITTAGVVTENPVPTASAAPAFGITVGPDNAIWFTETGANKIGTITTAGVFHEYPIPTASSSPLGITTGPDGNLWFTENATAKIGKMTTSGAVNEYPVDFGSTGIVTGPDNALWFADTGGKEIGRLSIAGASTYYAIPYGGTPYDITVGPDGALWFTESNAAKIGRITTAGTISTYGLYSNASRIRAASDGTLWMTETSSGAVARMY
jgi:virginiamycin B lyase